LSLGADLAAGVIVAQYVGAALLTAGLAGVGVWSSSVTRNQITAFILGTAVLFILILIGLDPLLVGLPAELGAYAASLSILSHFSNIARGVIDLRDIIYFVTLAAVFLFFAYQGMMTRKLAPHGQTIKRLRLGVMLLTAVAIVTNLFGRHIGGRLDLTPGKSYTLSRATRDLLAGLPDIVTLKLFASAEVPPQIALLKRDIDDLLRDYRSAGGGKVRVVVKDPAADTAAKQEAGQLGIGPVQFNVVGRSELQVKEGYLGLAVQYANKKQVIPIVDRTEDLEYTLSSFVRQLTRPNKPLVALVTSQRDQQLGRQYNRLLDGIEKSYEVRRIDDIAADSNPPAATKVLILAGTPDSVPPKVRDKIIGYLNRGGSALVFSAGMAMSGQTEFAQPLTITWNDVLGAYGLSISADMVLDIASNQPIPMNTQIGRIFVRYPPFLRALSTKASVVNKDLDGVLLPWSSSIDTSGVRKGTMTPLFVTSPRAAVEGFRVLYHPSRQWPTANLKTRLVAVQINPLAVDSAKAKAQPDSAAGPKGRLIVVGSTDFADDKFMAPENGTFLLNAVDWLSQDDAFISIRSKDRSPPKLLFSSAATQDAVKYVNVIGIPVLLILIASFRLWQRRRQQRRPYQPAGASGLVSSGERV
ncbi:MAG: Gldg family protein, partial [Gemmatimonadetes bacterium]|nr:Gldg family protein [Gemmatimonadota bacterium]